MTKTMGCKHSCDQTKSNCSLLGSREAILCSINTKYSPALCMSLFAEKVSQQAGGSFITKNISNLQINNPVDIVPQQGTFCTSDRSSDVYQPKTTKEEEEICVCMCGLKFTAEPKPGGE